MFYRAPSTSRAPAASNRRPAGAWCVQVQDSENPTTSEVRIPLGPTSRPFLQQGKPLLLPRCRPLPCPELCLQGPILLLGERGCGARARLRCAINPMPLLFSPQMMDGGPKRERTIRVARRIFVGNLTWDTTWQELKVGRGACAARWRGVPAAEEAAPAGVEPCPSSPAARLPPLCARSRTFSARWAP